MENKGNSQPRIERWTARRKADLASKIIKGQKTIVDAARAYDLKQSEIQKWIETFLEYGRQGLRANPRNAEWLPLPLLGASSKPAERSALMTSFEDMTGSFVMKPSLRDRL